mgnify:CR=1 FL=1
MFFVFHDTVYDRPIFLLLTDVVAVCPFRENEDSSYPYIRIILRTGVTEIIIFGNSYEELLEQMNSFGTITNSIGC